MVHMFKAPLFRAVLYTQQNYILMYCIIMSLPLQNVNRLAMETRRLVKCNHTRKTAAFVRACAAYCFITIPCLENKLSALNLYLLSGSVAIANGALSQGRCVCVCVCVWGGGGGGGGGVPAVRQCGHS